MLTEKTTLMVLTVVFCSSIASILVKYGVNDVDLSVKAGLIKLLEAIFFNPYIIISILMFSVSFVVYSMVLSQVNLSIAHPIITALGFVVIAISSVIIFQEKLTLYQIMGFILTAAGIWLISGK